MYSGKDPVSESLKVLIVCGLASVLTWNEADQSRPLMMGVVGLCNV